MSYVVLLTGASSWIGFDAARALAERGHRVYGAARRLDKLNELSASGVIPLQMDVTDESSMQAGVEKIISAEGHIDVLINNAGYGSYGAIEDVSIDEAKRQFEVNIFGVARLVQLVLPYMREKKFGRIINTSSMGGRITTPLGSWYHATKYALEAFSDGLRMETKPFGISVSIIEPGGIKTEWGSVAAQHLEESARGGAYEAQANKLGRSMKNLYSRKMLSSPAVITKAIIDAVESEKPKTRYLVGFGAKPLVTLKQILPDRAFDALMSRAM